jgi:hypothetical protein
MKLIDFFKEKLFFLYYVKGNLYYIGGTKLCLIQMSLGQTSLQQSCMVIFFSFFVGRHNRMNASSSSRHPSTENALRQKKEI